MQHFTGADHPLIPGQGQGAAHMPLPTYPVPAVPGGTTGAIGPAATATTANANSNNSVMLSSHAARLHNAVRTMRAAFLDILDTSNYTNVNFNDPHVSFAFNVFTRYNNDVDFFNTMQFPLDPLPTMDISRLGGIISPVNAISIGSSPLSSHPYLYHSSTPYLFSMFPSFPNLPTSAFTPTILENKTQYDRLCYIGACVLRYLIETTIFEKEQNYKTEDFQNVITSIMNEKSLTILCQAYNIEFNYKFIACTQPVESHLLFLAYFGTYYSHIHLTSNGSWKVLKLWAEQLLGYETQGQNVTNTTTQIIPTNVPQQIKENRKLTHGELDLNIYLQSVLQDINEHKTGTADLVFTTTPYNSDFKTVLSIDGVACTFGVSVSKKLSKVAAALIACMNLNFMKLIKRASREYWNRKYIIGKSKIRKALLEDERFKLVEVLEGFKNEDNCEVDLEIGHDHEENVNEGSVSTGDFYSTPANKAGESMALDVEMTPEISPVPAVAVNSHAHDDESSLGIDLSHAKEKLYAKYSSKYKIIPQYDYVKLNDGLFKATLTIGSEPPVIGIAASKKDASARAAMKFINSHKRAML